jgi:Uma2 family endonuclease
MEAMSVLQPYRFRVEDFERMGRAGVFDEDARVELLDGQIVEMTPIGVAHAGTVKALIRLLSPMMADRAILSVQDPVVVSDLSEPQPDVVLLRPSEDAYRTAHPRPEDVLLLIEVADTSGDLDRLVKGAIYARAGIPEYWIVNLQERALEIYGEPSGDSYRHVEEHRDGRVTPTAFPDAELDVGDILGPDPAR